MTEISNSELNNYLVEIIVNSSYYNQPAQFTFQALYDLGIRAGETNIERWEYKSITEEYELTTLKSKSIRKFTVAEMPKLLRLAIDTQNKRLLLNSYSAIEYNIRINGRGKLLFTNQKRLLSHAFRHNKAKQIYQNTGDYTAVKDFFNLSSLIVATQYVTTPIYKNWN